MFSGTGLEVASQERKKEPMLAFSVQNVNKLDETRRKTKTKQIPVRGTPR